MIISYRSVVGLDFTESELRFVEMVRGIRGLRISGYGAVDLSVGERDIPASRREVLVRKIKELAVDGKMRSKRVVVGIPREHYFFRKVSLPPVSSDKLKPIIKNQVERMFPIRGDQMVYDYQDLGLGKNGGREVVVVGAKSPEIDEIMSVIKAADLELLRVDMREISLCNLLKSKEGQLKDPLVFLNISEETAFIQLYVSGSPIICRKIALNGQTTGLENVIREVEKAIGFYTEISKEEKEIDRIFISGATAVLDRLLPHIVQSFKIKVEKLTRENVGIDLPGDFDLERLGHALGLALSGYQVAVHTMDLLPRRVKRKRERDEWIRMGVISLAILFLSLAFAIASVWRDEASLEKVQREIAAIEGRVNAARELKKEYEDLVRKVNTLNKLQAERAHWLIILKNLSEAMPEDAWLTSLDMEQGEPLRLSGNAASAATLIPLLESTPYLKNVKFEAPTTTRDYGGEEVETFRITADINWSGEDNAETE